MTLYVDCKCRMAQASDCGYCKGAGYALASTDELIEALQAKGAEEVTTESAARPGRFLILDLDRLTNTNKVSRRE